MTEQTLKLKVQDHRGFTLLSSGEGTSASLLYPAEYQPGDRIAIECAAPPCFCVAQLEDTLPKSDSMTDSELKPCPKPCST